MNGTTSQQALGDLSSALSNLLKAEMRLGQELLGAFGVSMPDLTTTLRTASTRAAGGCCKIPPPCWMPRSLGEITSVSNQCKSACLRIRVSNCDRVAHPVQVQATSDWKATITPADLNLGPFERGTIEVSVQVPDTAQDGESRELLVWVRGCRDYYVRWTIRAGGTATTGCQEVKVDDCPDYLHHWYDHFYCPRPCTHTGRTTTPNTPDTPNTPGTVGVSHG